MHAAGAALEFVTPLGAGLFRQNIERAGGLPRSARIVGVAIAQRMVNHPNTPYQGAESLAASSLGRAGVPMCERTARYALALLKRERFLAVQCCGGPVCHGGRHHAARLVIGSRELGNGWFLAGRFYIRQKGATDCTPSRRDSLYSSPKTEEEASPRLSHRRRGALRPPPDARAAARSGPQRVTARDHPVTAPHAGSELGPERVQAVHRCRHCGVEASAIRDPFSARCTLSPTGWHQL